MPRNLALRARTTIRTQCKSSNESEVLLAPFIGGTQRSLAGHSGRILVVMPCRRGIAPSHSRARVRTHIGVALHRGAVVNGTIGIVLPPGDLGTETVCGCVEVSVAVDPDQIDAILTRTRHAKQQEKTHPSIYEYMRY